jgi:hypothetical protein
MVSIMNRKAPWADSEEFRFVRLYYKGSRINLIEFPPGWEKYKISQRGARRKAGRKAGEWLSPIIKREILVFIPSGISF